MKGTYAFASQVSSINWAEPGSQENWQQALNELLRSGESSIKGEGQKFMEDHDWPKVAKRYLKLYEKAIQKLKASAK